MAWGESLCSFKAQICSCEPSSSRHLPQTDHGSSQLFELLLFIRGGRQDLSGGKRNQQRHKISTKSKVPISIDMCTNQHKGKLLIKHSTIAQCDEFVFWFMGNGQHT
eukprot:1408643-Amphidinium_carterae.2